MIFQPAIIALLLAAGLSLAMLAVASPFALQLIRHWDLGSGSERQLRLERLTYLFSMMVALVCALQVLSTLLFVFNADRMSVMFVGAMCAVGTLNANEYGFPALYAQLVAFFFAATWLAINRLDNQARDYPLTRLKYVLLLAYAPLAALVLYLQFNYFIRLEADVINRAAAACSRRRPTRWRARSARWRRARPSRCSTPAWVRPCCSRCGTGAARGGGCGAGSRWARPPWSPSSPR